MAPFSPLSQLLIRLLKGWVEWLTMALMIRLVSADSSSPTNSTDALAGAVRVPVLSNITVSTKAIFSMTAAFFRYNLLFPKALSVLPRVKGVDMARAQGQAMINTEVKAFNPMDLSERLQNAKELKAINRTIKVNHLLVLVANDSKECTFSCSK